MNARVRQGRRDYARAVEAHSGVALQLRIWLLGIEPLIWRRFLVSAAMPARDLDGVCQRVMGWHGGHLSGLHFPRPAGATARRLLVGERLEVGDPLNHVYDFGDSWRHEALVEERILRTVERPLVVAGARACPPEDCGGISGYEEVVAMLAKPGRWRDRARCRWLEEVHPGWSPEAFDVAAVNLRLGRMRLGV